MIENRANLMLYFFNFVLNKQIFCAIIKYNKGKLAMKIEGEGLIKVYPSDIENGMFVVPKHLKKIAMYAFRNLKNLEVVEMHDEIQYIGANAFDGCDNLESIIGLENANNMVSFGCCENCFSLKNIVLPQSIQFIALNAFRNCKSLVAVKLPKQCLLISAHAFEGCENLAFIEIPAGVELIEAGAFKGCDNLVVKFLDDKETKYIDDFIEEQKPPAVEMSPEEMLCMLQNFEFNLDELNYEEKPELTNEDFKQLCDDFKIKNTKFNVNGKEFLFPAIKVTVEQGAFSDVQEIRTNNQDTLARIMKSNYAGKITLKSENEQESFSLDMRLLKKLSKRKEEEKRQALNSQFLIPSGGIINWVENCRKNNYRSSGYSAQQVCEITISNDCRIVVEDYTQPKPYCEYTIEQDEFFTSVNFMKKEIVPKCAAFEEHEYERSHIFYYPYGTRFDEDMLKEIGQALSSLIDNARCISPIFTSRSKITEIRKKQKEIIELFFKGTSDRLAVQKIMQDIRLKTISAKTRKDWLPYFSGKELILTEETKTENNI